MEELLVWTVIAIWWHGVYKEQIGKPLNKLFSAIISTCQKHCKKNFEGDRILSGEFYSHLTLSWQNWFLCVSKWKKKCNYSEQVFRGLWNYCFVIIMHCWQQFNNVNLLIQLGGECTLFSSTYKKNISGFSICIQAVMYKCAKIYHRIMKSLLFSTSNLLYGYSSIPGFKKKIYLTSWKGSYPFGGH